MNLGFEVRPGLVALAHFSSGADFTGSRLCTVNRILLLSFAVSGLGLAICAIGFLPFVVMLDPDFPHISLQLARAGFVLYPVAWIGSLVWARAALRGNGPRWHFNVACALPYVVGTAVLACTAWWILAEEAHARRTQEVSPGLFVQATGPARARVVFAQQLGRARIVVGPQVECWTLSPSHDWAVIKRNMAEVQGRDLRISSAFVYYAIKTSNLATEGPLSSDEVSARTGVDRGDRVFTGQCDQRR